MDALDAKTTSLTMDFWVGLLSPLLVPIALLAYAPVIILRAYVTSVLWDWYVVPAFGAAPLRIVYAFGLTLLAGYMMHHRADKDGRKWYVKMSDAALGSLFALFCGWVGTMFI